MPKARLSRFLIDRIPEGWMNRLFPQGYEIGREDKAMGKEEGGDTQWGWG